MVPGTARLDLEGDLTASFLAWVEDDGHFFAPVVHLGLKV